MARIAGSNIPDNKKLEYSLPYINGIGLSRSRQIIKSLGLDANLRVKELTESEITKIREYIDNNFTVEADLSREVALNIKRLKEIGSYRGLRHKAGLPSRGQNTRTNSRTRKGKRVTMGSGRKRAASKT